MTEFHILKRMKAREFCLQALYQWHCAKQLPSEIVKQFQERRNMEAVDEDYFEKTLSAVIASCDSLDQLIQRFSDIKLPQLDPVTLTILRIGSYEIKSKTDIPHKVIINEGINLAKKFGPDQSWKLVNGILDKIAFAERKDLNRTSGG